MAQKKPQLIALLTPVGMGMHGQVMGGFIDSAPVCNDDLRVYHYFSKGLDEDSIRRTVLQILELPFNMIVTIGVSCARVAKKVIAEKGSQLPHLFIGITDPYEAGLAKDREDLVAHNMTGILYDPYESAKVAQYLCEAKPHVKKILIGTERIIIDGVDQNSNWVTHEIDIIKSVCEPKGVEVNYYPATNLADLYNYVEKNSATFDTLMLLEGGTGLTMCESLGQLCNNEKKTLFSGLIEPAASFASLGYGASYESMGEHAGMYAYRWLCEGVPLHKLPPYRDSKGRQAVANVELAAQQDLDPEHVAEICRKWDGIIFEKAIPPY